MNNIMTQEFAETITATVKREIPILEYVNKELSDKLESGSGATVSVLIPNFGKVSKGASFVEQGTPQAPTNVVTLGSIVDLQVNVDKVPVTLEITKIGASYDLLEKTLKLYTQNSQISEPRISNLARTVNKEVFQCVLTAAHSSIVGTIDFPALASAVAYVDESRVGDENAGMLSPLLNNSIASSGANKFANPRLGLELYNGVLGSWMDCEFFKSADAGMLQLGTTKETAFAISGDVAEITDGDTQLAISNLSFGGSTLTVIPKGTPIIIGTGTAGTAGSIVSPFTMSSVYGEDTGIIRTFVVTEDTPIVSGGATNVPVATIYLNEVIDGEFTASKAAVSNTFYSADEAQGDLEFFVPLLAGYKYALGAVFASKAIAFASAAVRPAGGNTDSVSSTLDGELNIRTTVSFDGKEGQDVWRVDTLYGMAPLYGTGAVALYGQV
jgi:hypothetical protein